MSLAQTHEKMSFDEFLAWSARQERGRYEYLDGEIIEMPGEGGAHNFVKGALYMALFEAAKRVGLRDQVLTDGMTVHIEHFNRGREPDAAVSTTPVADRTALCIVDPLIVAEVVSPSSLRDDTGDKLNEYFSVPSIQHYLIVRPDKRLIVHHMRGDGGKLITSVVTDPFLRLDPPGLDIDLGPVFEACGPAVAA